MTLKISTYWNLHKFGHFHCHFPVPSFHGSFLGGTRSNKESQVYGEEGSAATEDVNQKEEKDHRTG